MEHGRFRKRGIRRKECCQCRALQWCFPRAQLVNWRSPPRPPCMRRPTLHHHPPRGLPPLSLSLPGAAIFSSEVAANSARRRRRIVCKRRFTLGRPSAASRSLPRSFALSLSLSAAEGDTNKNTPPPPPPPSQNGPRSLPRSLCGRRTESRMRPRLGRETGRAGATAAGGGC